MGIVLVSSKVDVSDSVHKAILVQALKVKDIEIVPEWLPEDKCK
jgi:hypothetical protein